MTYSDRTTRGEPDHLLLLSFQIKTSYELPISHNRSTLATHRRPSFVVSKSSCQLLKQYWHMGYGTVQYGSYWYFAETPTPSSQNVITQSQIPQHIICWNSYLPSTYKLWSYSIQGTECHLWRNVHVTMLTGHNRASMLSRLWDRKWNGKVRRVDETGTLQAESISTTRRAVPWKHCRIP